MKKPQNRFIEEIEKDSAGSFAGSSENRSSGAGVAGKNDSSRKCGARRDGRIDVTEIHIRSSKVLYFRAFLASGHQKILPQILPTSMRIICRYLRSSCTMRMTK